MKPAWIALPLLALLLLPALAHDFWIEAGRFSAPAGTPLEARLFVGHLDDREERARDPRRLLEFYLQGPDGKRLPLLGEPGQSPAGRVEALPAGLCWLAYRSNFSTSELEPAKFEAYLREEGLEHILAERARLGESERPGREHYARCAKALVRGLGPDASLPTGDFAARLGLPVELTLGADPAFRPSTDPAGPAAQLPVSLLVGGAGVEGHLVVLERLDAAPQAPQVFRARTDAEGIARFPWPGEGRWLASAVHMSRSPQARDHEWKSHFASLCFEVPASQPAPTGG
jgi:hypothetical protein